MKRHMGKVTGFAAGFLVLAGGVAFQDISQIHGIQEWMKALSNGALLSGVLLTGIGLLVIISGEGVFDGIKYATKNILVHWRNGEKRYGSYYDYLRQKKKKGGASALLVPGICYLLLAVGFTLVFYLVQPA